jgi:hypothetical protein
MGISALRGMVSCVLLVLFPFSLFAADSNAAMLYINGSAWVNGAHVPRPSAAIFSGDLLQTRRDSVANINEPGSSITVMSDSLVQFEGTALKIEHGGVTVSTSKGVATNAGDVKVSPTSNSWTEFNVTDVDGTVRIAARKGDLTIFDGIQTTTLQQGQETTRDETNPDNQNSDKSGKKKNNKNGQNSGAVAGATGGWLNAPYAVAGGAVAAGAITTWVLTKNPSPASPAKP